MQNEVVQVGMGTVNFFGTIITALLAVITFFLIRYVKTNDEAIKELRKTTADHGVRIAVVEERLQ